MLTRRQLLHQGAVLGAIGGIAPGLFRPASAARTSKAASASTAADRTLVIVQLAGGNDGLNMVVPYADAGYPAARPSLAIDPSAVLPLDGRLGLNPAMGELKSLWDADQLAIVEGVGYPNMRSSHRDAMTAWETAGPEGGFQDGWLGRYFKQTGAQPNLDFAAVDVGSALAPMLQTRGMPVPVIHHPTAYHQVHNPDQARARLAAWQRPRLAARESSIDLPPIHDASWTAYHGALTGEPTADSYRPAASYSSDPFAGSLRLLASLIVNRPGTALGYVKMGGFDTHTTQRIAQDGMLARLSHGLAAFQADLAAHGKADSVLVVAWTEFGRRLRQNASEGTDDGGPATMLVLGTNVTGGIYGDLPSLKQLDAGGDIPWTTDFRSVYATLLEDWLGVDSRGILGRRFRSLGFVTA